MPRRLLAFPLPLLAFLLVSFVAHAVVARPAHALSSHQLFSPTGEASLDGYGYAVSSAGDFNGDGRPDFLVGAYGNDAGGTSAGRAYLYSGAAPGTPLLTFTGASSELFGYSVASAGDFNGDGFDDIIVGAPLGASNGRAYIFFGGATPNNVADLTLTGAAASDQFGISVAGVGDVNGDGYDDVIVGANGNDAGGSNAGRAYIFFGGATPNNVADVTLTGLAANDDFGISVAGAGDVDGDGFDDVIVGADGNDAVASGAGAAYVFLGGPAMNSAADRTFFGAAASDQLGFSVAGAGDVNGDGFADVIVGAPMNDAGGLDAGRAYVYLGGIDGDVTVDLILTGSASGVQMGYKVAGVGDVNGDGYDDVAVGAPNAGTSFSGSVYLYLGGSSLNAIADLLLTSTSSGADFGYGIAGARDLDGDGYGDLLIGDPSDASGGLGSTGRVWAYSVFPYQILSPNGGEQWVAGQPATVRWRGHDVADLAVSTDGGATFTTIAGSIGGDDDNTYTLAAPAGLSEHARVRLTYRGQGPTHGTSDMSDADFRIVAPSRAPAAASRLFRTFSGAAAGDELGFAVSRAGDVNGDGYDDVIIGAPFNDAVASNAGRAYVFFGGPDADDVPDMILSGGATEDRFGYRVGAAGDVNHDGYDDVIVGAPLDDGGGVDAGRAYIFFGGPSPDAIPDVILTGAAAGNQFGHQVDGIGDWNGDGFDDVLVGAPNNSPSGAAYIFFGGTSMDATPDLILVGAASGDLFGTAAQAAGDVNGDGAPDIIIGAYANDSRGTNTGRAYVYFGGFGADNVADWVLDGDLPFDNFGLTVAGVGDMNGDGYADIAVSAPNQDQLGSATGRVYVYFGGRIPPSTPDLILTGEAIGNQFGLDLATAGDVNGDGYADLVAGAGANNVGGASAGAAYVFYGGTAPDAVPDLVIRGEAGDLLRRVGSAGDFDGDGFDDLLIGAESNDAVGSAAGRAYVYQQGRYLVTTPNGGETWNVGGTQNVAWLGAEPADLWLSTDGGSTFSMIESNVGGAASNVLPIRAPHAPTRFARIRVTPHDASVTGSDKSDSSFTIQTSVALLSLVANLDPTGGATITWSSDPGVGPSGLAGYRVYRIAGGEAGLGTRIGPDLIAETRYHDAAGAAGATYRLTAVNGLQEELELGRTTIPAAAAGLRAWPSPIASHDVLSVELAAPMAAPGFAASDLDVSVYDLGGRRVATLAHGPRVATNGVISLRWSPGGRGSGAGVYFLRATAPSAHYRAERKLVVMP